MQVPLLHERPLMSVTYTESLLADAPAMLSALSREPRISIDLSYADLETIVLAMYCAMWLGRIDPQDLFDYITSRGANIRRETFDLILKVLAGDELSSGFWQVDEFGDYYVVPESCPAYWSENASMLPKPAERAPSA